MTAPVAPVAPPAGSAAPDLALHDPADAEVRLSDLWGAAPRAQALVFVRHFG